MDRSYILGFCTYMSSTAAFKLCRGISFRNLVAMVEDRWPTLSNLDLEITYSVAGYQSILLENDMDVEIMISHNLEICAERIHIHVVEKSSVLDNFETVQRVPTAPLMIGQSSSDITSHPNGGRRPTNEVVLASECWSNLLEEVGQVFEGGCVEFRLKLAKYAIEKGFNYTFIKNDSKRVTARCAIDYCPWKVHARSKGLGGEFYLKKWINHHDCNGGIRTIKHQRASSDLVANLLEQQIRSNPSFRPIDVQDHMKTFYGLNVTYFQALKGKEKALDEVQGDERLSFDRLRAYEEAILRSNPGSFTSLEYDQVSGKFERFFVAFSGCIEGFNHCRPMLFLDGTFLKSKYRGILLAACGKNGDQGMFPLCVAVVDAENESNWLWFLRKLAAILDPSRTIVFISDRNKGLIEGISTVFPQSPHGFCLEHLKQNLRKHISVYKGNKFREYLVLLFTQLVHARTEYDFIEQLTVFRTKGGVHVTKFLEDLPTVHWANAFFPRCRYGELTSNIAESFNSWIREERCLPIDVMLDKIRLDIMEQMSDRLRDARSWRTCLCPRMEKRLQELMRLCSSLKVTRSTNFIYEVHSMPKYVVDLRARSCGCREWDIEGFPCMHALVAIQFNEENVYDYCESYFKTSTFIESYSRPIYPVVIGNDIMRRQDEVVIKPPNMKRPAGRPKRKRYESRVGEGKKSIRCTRCGKVGNHNRRSCKEPVNN